jgi:general stress protein 26
MNELPDNREHVLEMMRGFDTGMLVSATADSQLRARPMAIAKMMDTGHVWFITNRHSGKVDEMLRDPIIAVTLQNSSQYVSLSGMAKLVDDRHKIHELWSEDWKVWFPDGQDDPAIILIHFVPEEMEYWDNAGTKGLRYLFKAGVAYLQGETPDVDQGIHAKVKG